MNETASTPQGSTNADFLKRHQDKLLFGSDCSCSDGHGAGYDNPAAPRMAGKCVACETLGLLKRSTSPVIVQKVVWGNVGAGEPGARRLAQLADAG